MKLENLKSNLKIYVPLVGIAGLLALYRHGHLQHHVAKFRLRRHTHLQMLEDNYEHLRLSSHEELMEDNDEGQDHTYQFLHELGWLAEGADVPEEFQEDVKLYIEENVDVNDERNSTALEHPRLRRAAKKTINVVIKCLKSERCTDKAMATVDGWGDTLKSQIEDNWEYLLKSVVTKVQADPGNDSGLDICTPNDPLMPCKNETLGNYVECGPMCMEMALDQFAPDPKYKYALTLDSHQHEHNLKKAETSSGLRSALGNLNIDSPLDTMNIFGRSGVKLFLIIPNGVPVHMADTYKLTWRNYWGWFKSFNEKYIGIFKESKAQQRQNYHFMFMRQDKKLKFMMKSPAKATKKFPWRRFDAVMDRPANTASQPKLEDSFIDLHKTIQHRYESDPHTGQDCFILWFHQYLPSDILRLTDSGVQETIKDLTNMCSIIHIWVGLKHENTLMTAKYIQGLLMPEQLSKTAIDPNLRDYFFVDDLEALSPENNENFSRKIYNSMALERMRTKCLLSVSSESVSDAIQKYSDEARTDEYGYSSDYSSDYYGEDYSFDESLLEGDDGEEDESDSDSDSEADVELEMNTEEDLICCGIGFSGKSYDERVAECCVTDSGHRIAEFQDGTSTCGLEHIYKK